VTEQSVTGDPGDLHGRPTAPELLDATIQFLRDQLMEQLDGALRHQVRIAVHALEVIAREMELGPEQAKAHAARLGALGVQTDAELAAAIRSGTVADTPELRRLLREDTRDRLLVANPRWL
jgi:Domain of unknown function (DUF6285)